ncbi:unnamed protein product [Rotaria socialis]|uniref:nicotinamidase n=1 Tax=Rotaria socialis TaxID=392032 RepID=A0A817U3X1_9BILA|nr:unnamed protein product [Rotaria socialis]CAF3325599.1 unnamed protein product [Rotaria socialis]CAF3423567.1 unnamed protein product [Rotaria socialis]CAF3667799.1 unnamed protein product [Rotaria socialis]
MTCESNLRKRHSNSHRIFSSMNIYGDSQMSKRPVNALLIIDVQNDFIDGSLALRNCPSKHNGEEVIPIINDLLDSGDFDVIVYSIDWHPADHISFYDNLHLRSHLLTNDSIQLADLHLHSNAKFDIPNVAVMEQVLWPRHCVQNTTGANLHPDLKVFDASSGKSVIYIFKGTKPNIDSYSAFWDNLKLSETNLHQQLQEKNVSQIFVTGLATDYCVYSTAANAVEYGYKTFIIKDGCRGVDEKHIKEKLDNFKQNSGHVIQSSQVKDYVQ